jgi:SH3-like domain-containing protein
LRRIAAGAGALGLCIAAPLVLTVMPSAKSVLAAVDNSPAHVKGILSYGSVSGLPLPRFVSLKADDVNVRRGPGGDHEVAWTYKKAGLPVEIIAEWDNWRKIRDADGEQGWVWHSLLSGKRDVLVEPWGKPRGTLPLYAGPQKDDRVVALLQRNVLAKVSHCTGSWCRIWSSRFDGWMRQDHLWGVYPGEKVD